MDKFTELFPQDLTFERKSRLQKGKKIKAILKDYLADLSKLSCLDLGCSIGHISAYLARNFGEVWGVDVDEAALKMAKRTYKERNLNFKISAENKIPFPRATFDVVIFNQIYEHVESPKKVFGEIKRVLKRGGVCFFGARNKYFVFDGHYPIPFLPIFPRSLADFLIKIFYSKEKYDINLYSLDQLKKLTREFSLVDYTLAAIMDPRKFNARDVVPSAFGINRILYFFGRLFYAFIPNYLWVLVNK